MAFVMRALPTLLAFPLAATLVGLPAVAVPDPVPTDAVDDGTGGPRVPLDRDQLVNAAPSTEAGVVESADEGILVLRPFDPRAEETQFRLFADTPVFDAKEQVTRDALRPGAEVRVHYAGGGLANAIAIDVLSPGEARRERALLQPVDEYGNARAPHQDGTIARISGNTVVIELWTRSRTNAYLRLAEDVVVREGGDRVGPGALSVGDDVRVYRGQLDRIVGVDILTPDEARRLRSDAGNRSQSY